MVPIIWLFRRITVGRLRAVQQKSWAKIVELKVAMYLLLVTLGLLLSRMIDGGPPGYIIQRRRIRVGRIGRRNSVAIRISECKKLTIDSEA